MQLPACLPHCLHPVCSATGPGCVGGLLTFSMTSCAFRQTVDTRSPPPASPTPTLPHCGRCEVQVLRLWEALWSCPSTPQLHLYCCVAVLEHHRRCAQRERLGEVEGWEGERGPRERRVKMGEGREGEGREGEGRGKQLRASKKRDGPSPVLDTRHRTCAVCIITLWECHELRVAYCSPHFSCRPAFLCPPRFTCIGLPALLSPDPYMGGLEL